MPSIHLEGLGILWSSLFRLVLNRKDNGDVGGSVKMEGTVRDLLLTNDINLISRHAGLLLAFLKGEESDDFPRNEINLLKFDDDDIMFKREF